MPALAERLDPGVAYKFYLEIEGVIVAEFTELSGISVEREVKEYQEGGINDYVHRLPGRVKAANVTLKRGLSYSNDLWNWFQQGLYDGKVKRVSLSIIFGDSLGKRVKQWDVTGAFPVKYSTSDVKADGGDASIETLELAHQGIVLNPQKQNPM